MMPFKEQCDNGLSDISGTRTEMRSSMVERMGHLHTGIAQSFLTSVQTARTDRNPENVQIRSGYAVGNEVSCVTSGRRIESLHISIR